MAMNANAGSPHIISRELSAARRELSIDACRPGMLLAETLYSPQGAVILQEKTVLTQANLQRLQHLGFSRIKTRIPEAEAREAAALYERRYQSCLSHMGNVFTLIAHGRRLDPTSVREAADSVLESAASGSEAFFQNTRPQKPDGFHSLRIHSLNTAMLSTFLHQWLNQDESLLPILVQAALLHDIGKTKLNPQLLELPGEMSPKEESAWKTHPREGWALVQACKGLHPLVSVLVAMHHERPDGSGYPMGLRNGNIHPLARILAVANRFDNLTTGTARMRSVSPFQAFAQLEKDAREGFFPDEIHCLLHHIPPLYVGDRFFLSNGDIGEVLHINEHAKSRPLVRTAHGFMDLSSETDVTMEAMV